MTKRNNKRIEKYYFNLFAAAYAQLPAGEILYCDKPDIMINGERNIGIEITNLYLQNGKLPESEQRQRVLRGYAVSKAQQNYLKAGGRKIEISFGFDRNVQVTNAEKLSQNIERLAHKIDNFKSGEIPKTIFSHIPEIFLVYVNSTEYENPKWRADSVYLGQTMSRENLISTIKDKEIKAKNYQRCDEYWLLIIVDFMDRAQDQEIKIDGIQNIRSDVFKKIIVYKPFNHFVEISAEN